MTSPTAGKFPLGQMVITPNALSQISSEEVFAAMLRHRSGD